jgi:hypothetical protein
MQKRLYVVLAIIVSIMLVIPVSSMALPMVPVDLEGMRTSAPGGGITASAGWADGNFELEWDHEVKSGHYEYTYKIKTKGVPGAGIRMLSHWIFQISDDVPARDFREFAVQSNTESNPDIFGDIPIVAVLDTYDGTQPGNPDMPGSIYGFKIETITGDDFGPEIHIAFNSYRAPVWGDFYAKDGKEGDIDVTAWNNGLATPSDNEIDYIVVPDTTVIPEPGTIILMVLGLLGLAGVGLKKKNH